MKLNDLSNNLGNKNGSNNKNVHNSKRLDYDNVVKKPNYSTN